MSEGKMNETVEAAHHPAHYGGGENPYEAIKVIFDDCGVVE